MELLEKLSIEMAEELAQVYAKYLSIFKKIVYKCEKISDIKNVTAEEKNEINQLLKDLQLNYFVMKPVFDYILEKTDQTEYCIKSHEDISRDLKKIGFNPYD